MEFSHIGMFKGTLDSDSLFGIKFKHFLAKINSLWVLAHAEKFFEVFTRLRRELLHKCFIVSVLDFIDQWCIWTSCQIDDHLHLLSTVLSRHQWLSSNHFCKDTSNRPYINCCCILLPWKNNLWSSIPSRCDIIRKLSVWCHKWISVGSGKTKVTDLEITVWVDEKIARFQISV